MTSASVWGESPSGVSSARRAKPCSPSCRISSCAIARCDLMSPAMPWWPPMGTSVWGRKRLAVIRCKRIPLHCTGKDRMAQVRRLTTGIPTRISVNNGYVDNPPSTPYRPQETVAHGEGERYAASTAHPSTPGVPAAPAVAFLQYRQPRLGGRLSGPPACPPLCPHDAGGDHPCAHKLRGPYA